MTSVCSDSVMGASTSRDCAPLSPDSGCGKDSGDVRFDFAQPIADERLHISDIIRKFRDFEPSAHPAILAGPTAPCEPTTTTQRQPPGMGFEPGSDDSEDDLDQDVGYLCKQTLTPICVTQEVA